MNDLKEIWKPIEGYEGLYEISNLGSVKSVGRYENGHKKNYSELYYRKEKMLKPSLQKGYYFVNLCKNGKRKCCKIHRLVAEAFIPNPNNLPIINHRDENKLNNIFTNLEWCTVKYNNNYGTRNNRLSKTKCKEIVCVETGVIYESAKCVEKQLKIKKSHINDCCNGKRNTWNGCHWRYVA